MKIATAPAKQFNLSHIRIDENLQGARLASFSKRLLAYSMDWIIIWCCTQFIGLVIPLGLLLLLFKRKLNRTIVKSRRLIKKNAVYLGNKLESSSGVQPVLKRRFTRGVVIYLYILLYLPVFVAFAYIAVLILGYVSPQQYESVTANTAFFLGILTKPITDLTDAMNLISRFFGAFVYFSVFAWKWKGQTPGKRLMKIRIVKLNGTPMTFWNSLERASGYTASAAIIFLGFFQYFWDRNAQTTHDKITETIVIEN